MSFWIHIKGKDGRKRLVGVDFPFSIVIAALCLVASIFVTFLNRQLLSGVCSIGLIVTGILSLIISKLEQFRKGKLFTWGVKDMPKILRVFYYLGSVLISVGLILAFIYFIINS